MVKIRKGEMRMEKKASGAEVGNTKSIRIAGMREQIFVCSFQRSFVFAAVDFIFGVFRGVDY
jgi:hypothetical protein